MTWMCCGIRFETLNVAARRHADEEHGGYFPAKQMEGDK